MLMVASRSKPETLFRSLSSDDLLRGNAQNGHHGHSAVEDLCL